jgi:hypothetical protein
MAAVVLRMDDVCIFLGVPSSVRTHIPTLFWVMGFVKDTNIYQMECHTQKFCSQATLCTIPTGGKNV